MYEALVARVRYHIQKANFMGLKEAESTLLLAEAADAIEELSKLNAEITKRELKLRMSKPRWIPVTERLPEKDQTVLAYCAEDNFCYISRMHQSFEDYDVTHWIPLPKMPKDGES